MATTRKNALTTAPRSEREAVLYAMNLDAYIKKNNGQYIQADDGSLHLVMQGRRTALSFDRNNHSLARLMLSACNVSSLSPGAQAAIQRLQVSAQQGASSIVLRNFSGLSADRRRLYIPLHGGQLLSIAPNAINIVANGNNEDKLWVEHPNNVPFRYNPEKAPDGLNQFERLLVETQSCRIPAMRWLVAMHEGLFPYVREICRARFLLVHIGGTQQGKTTGAERFTQLHGLGEVKGDYSVAALANMPDIGLLVMDNREQSNFNQQLIDFCLFLSTGAERARSSTDGQLRRNSSRPVGVITSIEGAWKAELQARCVEVSYEICGTRVDRDDVTDEILRCRDGMLSAMVPVFHAWLRIRTEGSSQVSDQCPRPNFERHFCVLAELMSAYAEVAGKPAGWTEAFVSAWREQLSSSSAEGEDELENSIQQLLNIGQWNQTVGQIMVASNVRHDGKQGVLYVTEVGTLLDALRKTCPRDIALPKNSTGLGRRLRSAKFRAFQFLNHEIAPDLPQLNRTATKRPIGFFVPDDNVTDT
jgi:hypothetical protein